jgi:hypothetical protein
MMPPPRMVGVGCWGLGRASVVMTRKRAHHGSGWTSSDLRKLKALVDRGTPRAEIASVLGRSVSAVYQRIVTERLSPRADLE